jgi:rod shape-determining protein MreC
VRLAADYERLEFLRVLRNFGTEPIDNPGNLIVNKNLKSLPDDQSAVENGT